MSNNMKRIRTPLQGMPAAYRSTSERIQKSNSKFEWLECLVLSPPLFNRHGLPDGALVLACPQQPNPPTYPYRCRVTETSDEFWAQRKQFAEALMVQLDSLRPVDRRSLQTKADKYYRPKK